MTLLGIVIVTAWGSERVAALKPGGTIEISHYQLTFDGLFNRPGPNYRGLVGHFTVRRASGELIGAMEPSRRTFPARNMATTEAALMTRGVSQLYLSLGDPNPDGSIPVRLYFKPQVLHDLAWRADHVCRRSPVDLRSPPAYRRSAARERARIVGRGGRNSASGSPKGVAPKVIKI